MAEKHKEAQEKIKQLGERLGYVAFTEAIVVSGRTDVKVDMVWFDSRYKNLYGDNEPNLQEKLCLVEVAFEVENFPDYTEWHNIQGCIGRIEATGANLGVIALPSKGEIQQRIQQNPPPGRIWGKSAEDDIANVREWISRRHQRPRIIVLTLDEIETLLNKVQEQSGN